MLMHHTDAEVNRIQRAVDLSLLPPNGYLSLIRRIEPVEDIHQSCLSGAVLPQQSQDLALIERQIHMIVGQYSGEGLGDPAQFEQWRHRYSLMVVGDGSMSQ